jgi:hypothetical protein
MVFNKYNFKQTGGAGDTFLIYAILIAIVFFLCVMPMIEKYYKLENKALVEKLENAVMPLKVDTHKCARSCCVNSGWPVPDEVLDKDIPESEMKDYIPTNYSCNFGSNNGSGCLCVTKQDVDYLGSRGGNGVTGCKN